MTDPDTADLAKASRRRFLRHACWLVLPALGLHRTAAHAMTSGRSGSDGERARTATSDVRRHGAVGDGVHDDTDAFQAAVDALPPFGGVVRVPAGRYRIDAARSVRLRSHTQLVMDPDAQLLAKPNALQRYAVILIKDVHGASVRGGRIVGERDEHLGSDGEWGHGIAVSGASDVGIRDIDISSCWGDGIWIGSPFKHGRPGKTASDVTIERVVCRGNRRQGLSITTCRRITVRDSHFTDTGGTLPGCGIDVEPGTLKMGTQDVQIADCIITGNRGSGVQLAGTNIRRLRLERCEIRDNRGYGVLVTGARQATLADNSIRQNGLKGLRIRGAVSGCVVSGNTFQANNTHYVRSALKRAMQALTEGGVVPSVRDMEVDERAEVTVRKDNRFLP